MHGFVPILVSAACLLVAAVTKEVVAGYEKVLMLRRDMLVDTRAVKSQICGHGNPWPRPLCLIRVFVRDPEGGELVSHDGGEHRWISLCDASDGSLQPERYYHVTLLCRLPPVDAVVASASFTMFL